MNTYECKLYRMILNHKKENEKMINELLVIINDLLNKALQSKNDLSKNQNEELDNFEHCGECRK